MTQKSSNRNSTNNAKIVNNKVQQIKKNEPPKQLTFINKPLNQLLIAVLIMIIGGSLIWSGIFFTYDFLKKVLATENLPEFLKPEEEEIASILPADVRRLDGVIVKPEKNNPYPIGVMIENLSVVRPQSGLSAASIIYETLAEGGITRFLAIFPGADAGAQEVGPVRSAREYYVEWISEYDALYAHCGGSPQALQAISAFNIKDLNQIWGAHPYFWRKSDRSAPHNLFTSSELLSRALRDRNLDQVTPNYEPWQFKNDLSLDARPTEEKFIKINWNNSLLYQAHYQYQRETNDYLRFHGDTPHLDANTGEQIVAKNIIVIRLKAEEYYPTKDRLKLDLHGQGEALIFLDGGYNLGTWEKTDRVSRTRFYYQNGEEVKLNPGPIWIEVLPGERTVDYN